MTVRINELLEYVRQGKIMDAMKEFYAEDSVMTEPAYGATNGLAANLEREQKFVDSVAEFKRFDTPAVAIDGDTSVYENVMDWVGKDGKDYHVEQVVVAKWNADGKIVHERFYYDRG
ncbi:MAG: nuclear transport factor 2 family protein [Planctomycetota bacterium]